MEEDAADSPCVIESVPFLNESYRNAILISTSCLEHEMLGGIQIAFLVVSTDRLFPWDNSTVYKPNASDVERICSARRQRSEPAQGSQHQARNGQKKNPQQTSKFNSIVL
jgi:hypothetical protein